MTTIARATNDKGQMVEYSDRERAIYDRAWAIGFRSGWNAGIDEDEKALAASELQLRVASLRIRKACAVEKDHE